MKFSHFSGVSRRWLAIGILLIVILGVGSYIAITTSNVQQVTYTPHNLPGVRPFITTTNNIHLLQSFASDISDPTSAAKSYDFVWGPKPDKVAAFRLGNPHVSLAYYLPFTRDNGTYSDSGSYHDLHYWRSVHPDWVLYQCDRKTPAYEFGDPNVPLDVTNPAIINWFMQTYIIPASKNGNYDAIGADNVNMGNLFGACGIYKDGHWTQLYSGQSDDPRWAHMIVNWLGQMQSRLHTLAHPMALIPNFVLDGYAPTDPLIQQAVKNMDGLLDEDGFTHNADTYTTGSNWLDIVQFMQSVQAQGKPYYSVNQFKEKSVSRADIQWALSSYLMGKENLASVFISSYQDYGKELLYQEYAAHIGSPTGDMQQEQQVYWRPYTGGVSIVNPSANHTYTITLPTGKHYTDLYGNVLHTTLTLHPHQGIVLLTS